MIIGRHHPRRIAAVCRALTRKMIRGRRRRCTVTLIKMTIKRKSPEKAFSIARQMEAL